MDGSPPGFSVCGSFRARILEWIAISFSRLSSWPRNRPHVLVSPALRVDSFTAEPLENPQSSYIFVYSAYCASIRFHFMLGITDLILRAFIITMSCSHKSLRNIVFWMNKCMYMLPLWLSSREAACQCRRHDFNPWVEKVPWRKKWQPTPVFLPEKSHGQRSLMDYSLWGCEHSDLVTKQWHVNKVFCSFKYLKF